MDEMDRQPSVVEREFDGLAADYESNRLSRWYKAHADEILEHCPEQLTGDVLDIGCATGYLLRRLSEKTTNAALVGVDLSPNMIAEAKRKTAGAPPGRFRFFPGDWEDLDRDTLQRLNGFDFRLMVCANAFHYFAKPREAAEDMYKMLGENGILLVLEREKHDSPLTAFWGFLHRHFIKDQVSFYSATELVDLLREVGFEDVRVMKTINRYFWKGKLFTSIALIGCTKRTGTGRQNG